jgi:hypothetical protein
MKVANKFPAQIRQLKVTRPVARAHACNTGTQPACRSISAKTAVEEEKVSYLYIIS